MTENMRVTNMKDGLSAVAKDMTGQRLGKIGQGLARLIKEIFPGEHARSKRGRLY